MIAIMTLLSVIDTPITALVPQEHDDRQCDEHERAGVEFRSDVLAHVARSSGRWRSAPTEPACALCAGIVLTNLIPAIDSLRSLGIVDSG
jgi:hypothetical protein